MKLFLLIPIFLKLFSFRNLIITVERPDFSNHRFLKNPWFHCMYEDTCRGSFLYWFSVSLALIISLVKAVVSVVFQSVGTEKVPTLRETLQCDNYKVVNGCSGGKPRHYKAWRLRSTRTAICAGELEKPAQSHGILMFWEYSRLYSALWAYI